MRGLPAKMEMLFGLLVCSIDVPADCANECVESRCLDRRALGGVESFDISMSLSLSQVRQASERESNQSLTKELSSTVRR